MTTRITATTSSRMMLADIMDAQRALTAAQGRISSGKMLQKASDGPANALAAMDHRQTQARATQFERNANDARGWLETADTALTGTVDTLSRVRELVLLARNSSNDTESRAAAAAEIRSIRENLLQTANTTYLGRPIFGGTVNGAAAYDATGTYVGDTGTVQRPVSPGVTLRVERTGPEVFGATSATPMDGDLFQMLDAVATAVAAGDQTAMATGLDRISSAADRIEMTQVELGARARQVEDLMARATVTEVDRRRALSELEDVDVAEALIDVKAREFSYQAALGVSGRVLSTSLLDYLR